MPRKYSPKSTGVRHPRVSSESVSLPSSVPFTADNDEALVALLKAVLSDRVAALVR